MHTVLRRKLTFRPVTERNLLAEIGNDALVILELCLNVAQKTVGTILRLSDYHHEIDEPFRLEHQP